jgi:hypothetical protein
MRPERQEPISKRSATEICRRNENRLRLQKTESSRRAPASLNPETAAFPSYTKIIFRAADRPKPQKFHPEIRKKRHRVDDDFAVAFAPMESEPARARQQFLQASLKDSNSKNTKQLGTTKHNARTLKAAGAAIDYRRALTH